MKYFKIALLVVLIPLLTAAGAHKFYVSITKVEHNQETQSLQIITKIFIDDVEDVLNERYQVETQLGTKKETARDRELLKEYISKKLKINVNGKPVTYDYLGVEYDTDIVKSFIEIKNVETVESIEIENKVLMEKFEEQQNIIHFKIDGERRSLVLERDNAKGLLKF